MIKSKLAILSMAIFLLSCSVISRQVRDEAIGPVPFKDLIEDIDQYRGQTVILGGYVIDVQNRKDKSVMTALQVPLLTGEQPAPKDRSQGRLIITYKGFLDPEVYTKQRKITLAGKIIASSKDKPNAAPYPYLELEGLEIHLWPLVKEYWPAYPYPYFYDDPFYPFPWYWYPYHHRHLHDW
jgi:outer membrane lipoprotein